MLFKFALSASQSITIMKMNFFEFVRNSYTEVADESEKFFFKLLMYKEVVQ